MLAIAVAGCLLGYRESEGRTPRSARLLQLWAARLDDLLAFRHPSRARCRGLSVFIGKTAWRHPGAGLIVRGWLVVGIAVVLAGFGSAAVRGELQVVTPVAATIAPAVVLPFFGLVGLRLSAAYPAHLEANWLFRVTDPGRSAEPASAIRATALRAVVLPLLLPLALTGWLLWGTATALPLALLALAIALVTAEWLFAGFTKIPFTCSYLPGKANLRASWPVIAVVALTYCVALPELLRWALAEWSAWLSLLALLVAVWGGLLGLSRQHGQRSSLTFDERAAPLVTQLRLDD
jgi:hypothetical protein